MRVRSQEWGYPRRLCMHQELQILSECGVVMARIRCFKKRIGACLSRAGTTCSCKRHNAEKGSTHKKLPIFHRFCRLRCNSSIWAATGPSWFRGGLQLSFCLQCYVHMLWKRMLRCRKTRTVIRRGNVVFPSPINSTKYVFLYSS